MEDYSRKMLSEIRRVKSNVVKDLPKPQMVVEKDNLYNRFNILMEEAENDIKKKEDNGSEPFIVKKSDIQFGQTRQSQEDNIKKTIGDVSFKDDSLKYYKDIKDLVLNGEINGLGITFQFRYKDPSGDGCYIWSNGLQMTDSNAKTIGKIRDAFLNWKQSLVDDGDLMDKLYKEANKDS